MSVSLCHPKKAITFSVGVGELRSRVAKGRKSRGSDRICYIRLGDRSLKLNYV
ncbi:MAG TPA: hypothetical protein V6C90_28905 [Coleofasciculaceae cyanobacterium]